MPRTAPLSVPCRRAPAACATRCTLSVCLLQKYDINSLATEVIFRNDAERREAASSFVDPTTEFSNLYPITSGLPSGARDDRRHAVLSALADRLKANGWFIDSVRFGIVTAHRRGAARPAPEQIARIVRIYPAYTFQVREYHQRPYLIVDATVVVQSVLNGAMRESG
jgi:hypothetical protein